MALILRPAKHRYLLFLSYIGTKFQGSQRQIPYWKTGNGSTVQEAVDNALMKLFPHSNVVTTSASRTDKGVHATLNCLSISGLSLDIPTEKLVVCLNQNLRENDKDIIIRDCLIVPASFHPRKNVVEREYIYRLCILPEYGARNDIFSHSMRFLPVTELYRVLPIQNLDSAKLHEVISLLSGYHDFASFTSGPSSRSNTKRLLNIKAVFAKHQTVDGSSINICDLHFRSTAFLYNQIRKLVTCILAYASEDRIDLTTVKGMLNNPGAFNYKTALKTIPPWGLYLSEIKYKVEKI